MNPKTLAKTQVVVVERTSWIPGLFRLTCYCYSGVLQIVLGGSSGVYGKWDPRG
jgi:hypothetical protein